MGSHPEGQFWRVHDIYYGTHRVCVNSLYMLSSDNLCKQFGLGSDLTVFWQVSHCRYF